MESLNTIKLLRIPFSFFLAPIYFFALAEASQINILNAIAIFFILHLLVYPASNGYNSYIDRDTNSIGGLKNPPMPTQVLFYITLLMDITAIVLSALMLGATIAILVSVYIGISRAYSSKVIRIKRYAWPAFGSIFLCQGALVYFIVSMAVSDFNFNLQLIPAAISSLIIGAAYPLTQIYQQEEDRKVKDMTLSIRLGYTGTFVFSGLLFFIASLLFYSDYLMHDEIWKFYVWLIFTLPVISYFLWWFRKVMKNEKEANFKNTMRMNLLSASFITSYFIFLMMNK